MKIFPCSCSRCQQLFICFNSLSHEDALLNVSTVRVREIHFLRSLSSSVGCYSIISSIFTHTHFIIPALNEGNDCKLHNGWSCWHDVILHNFCNSIWTFSKLLKRWGVCEAEIATSSHVKSSSSTYIIQQMEYILLANKFKSDLRTFVIHQIYTSFLMHTRFYLNEEIFNIFLQIFSRGKLYLLDLKIYECTHKTHFFSYKAQ